MKSITERQFVNGYKWTKEKREAADLRVEFLRAKYKSAISFFWVTWKLHLWDRDGFIVDNSPYGPRYMGEKLTQLHTYGKYDANQPERGSRVRDQNDNTIVPSWFKGKPPSKFPS